MKIYLPTINNHSVGGGWTFMRNIISGMKKYHNDIEFVTDVDSADVLLVSGVTLVDPETLNKAKEKGKKIIFRVDNIPRKSRNKRSRVYSNMKNYAKLADAVVFQSEWAKDYAGFLTGTEKSHIIYNGVDTDIFFRAPESDDGRFNSLKYLYIQSQNNDNKRFPEAAYLFHQYWKQDKNISLTILGEFNSELINADFDFFAGEDVVFLGVIPDPYALAKVYQEHDVLLFPAFADASPNTVLEARACGLHIEGVNPIGGTKELLNPELDISLERMCSDYYKLFQLI
jgi:glycosyltransferase involved in cell wall biosynthesis